MSRVVLSIGSNLGDRLARLQSVVDALGGAVRAVSPVYEKRPWGGVEQGPFLNAVLVAEDPALDCRGWLRRAQQFEAAADRVRAERWGPRTLDVDLVTCHDGRRELTSRDDELTLPHPSAHLRAFVLIPWLGILVYMIVRGHGMQERQIEQAQAMQKAQNDYVRSVATASTSPADQIASAKGLLDSGAITQAEFDQLKAKALAG